MERPILTVEARDTIEIALLDVMHARATTEYLRRRANAALAALSELPKRIVECGYNDEVEVFQPNQRYEWWECEWCATQYGVRVDLTNNETGEHNG